MTQVFIHEGVPYLTDRTFICDVCGQFATLSARADLDWCHLSEKEACKKAVEMNFDFTFREIEVGGDTCPDCGETLCASCWPCKAAR